MQQRNGVSSSYTNGAAARPLREKVTFPINAPVVLTLDYDDGELTAGRFGDQYMFTFDSGSKIAWLDPEVRTLIQRSGAGEGDTIAITKRETRTGNRRKTTWEVERVADEENPMGPTPAEEAAAERAAAQARAAQTAAANADLARAAREPAKPKAKPAGKAEPPAPAATPAAAPSDNPLAQALILAIDACEIASHHAQTAHTWDDWSFSDDAIVKLAITAFIQASGGRPRP